MATRNRITVDSLIEDLAADRALARELGQPSAAIAATQLTAKLAGLLVDRKETGAPGDFAGLQSEEQVMAMVKAELGEEAAQQLAQALQAAEQAQPSEIAQAEEIDPPHIEPTNEGSSSLN